MDSKLLQLLFIRPAVLRTHYAVLQIDKISHAFAGESVYGEKRISVEGEKEGEKIEYRVWNPFRSKLAASVLAGVDNIHVRPGCKVLYLGAASGTSVSHVSDIVGPQGAVYAVEFSHRSGAPLFATAPFSFMFPVVDVSVLAKTDSL